MTAADLQHSAQDGQPAEVETVVGDGRWLSTAEAAAIIGVSTSTVIRLVDERTLPATYVGNRRRILRSVAEAYRDKMEREAGGDA